VKKSASVARFSAHSTADIRAIAASRASRSGSVPPARHAAISSRR